MRRIISFIVMVCVLHTQTYYATYDGLDKSGPAVWQHGLAKQTVDLKQLEDGCEKAESKPLGIDVVGALKHHATTLKERVAAFKEGLSAFVLTPAGFTLTILAGTIVFTYGFYLYIVGMISWAENLPFDVASKQLTQAHFSSYDPLDTCLNFLGSGKELGRTRYFAHYDHATTSNGVSLLDAIPQWVNNATNLVSMLSTLVLAQRAVGRTHYGSSHEFERDFAKLLYTYDANMHKNYSCTFKLGETPATDAVTGCQEDPQKDLYAESSGVPEDADALIQFRRWYYKQQFKYPDDLSVRLTVNRNALKDQRYPVLDYSPDHTQLDEAARVSMQRRLLQLGNGLPLAEAVKDRVGNNLQIMAQLNAMLYKLRFRETVGQADVAALSALVRSVFTANQLALTSDVGCDVEFAGGQFKLLECVEGSHANVQSGTPIPEDAQVWFVRDWANGVSYVNAIANGAPVTEAMAVWLKQSTEAMHSLWVVANTLHHRVCNGTSDTHIELLRKAAQHQLMERDAYLQGDLACDIRLSEGGIGEVVCHSGVAPVTNETCELESTVPVRWEGKLWLKPHALNPSLIDGTTVAVNPVWQASRSGTRPYSPSDLASREVSASDTGDTGTVDATNDASGSFSNPTHSFSDEPTAEVTDSASGGSPSKGTASGSDSADLSAEVSTSGSGSGTHSPSLPNANTTEDGITELYALGSGGFLDKFTINKTHVLSVESRSLNLVLSFTGFFFDPRHNNVYWSARKSSPASYKQYMYFANATKLSTSSSSAVETGIYYAGFHTNGYPKDPQGIFVSITTGKVFWGEDYDIYCDIYTGDLDNLINPSDIVNKKKLITFSTPGIVTSKCTNGLYFDELSNFLLVHNEITEQILHYPFNNRTRTVGTGIVILSGPQLSGVVYDRKNRRLLFANSSIQSADYDFTQPAPITKSTPLINPFSGIGGSFSINNY